MSLCAELERDLADFRTAIALLEQARGYFFSQTPANGCASDRAVEKQVEGLLARLDMLKNTGQRADVAGEEVRMLRK